MPTYDFKCSKCDHTFTELVSMDSKDQVDCPVCGEKPEQLFTWGGAFSIGGSNTGGCGSGSGCGSSGPFS